MSSSNPVDVSKCSCSNHLFAKPVCENQSLLRKIMNVVFHILTFGIPLLFYRIIACCTSKSTPEAQPVNLQSEAIQSVQKKARPLSEMMDIKNPPETVEDANLTLPETPLVPGPQSAYFRKLEMVADRATYEFGKIKGFVQEAKNPPVSVSLVTSLNEEAGEFQKKCGLPAKQFLTLIVESCKDEAIVTNAYALSRTIYAQGLCIKEAAENIHAT